MPIHSDNRRSGLGKQIGSAMLASLILLSQTFSLSPASAATSDSSKPVLKAIDPSQAKMDALPKPSTLNPMGGIQGTPISADKPGGLPGGTPSYTPYNQPPGGYAQPGFQPVGQSGYQQGGYPQYQQPPAYQNAPPGYPTGYPVYQPSTPTGYPGYPPAQPQYGFGQPAQPNYAQPNYGQPAAQPSFGYGQPAYGGGQSAPVTSPPGYPSMPPAYSNYNTPPGFVQPGANTYQQRPPQAPAQNAYQQPPPQNSSPGSFPAGRARLGGGHPNLVPQGAPVQSGPQSPGGSFGGGSSGFPSNQSTSYAQPPGFVQSSPQGFSPGGYPAPSAPQGYPSYGGMSSPGQFSSNNYPNPNLIPDFGKPLPLDASSRGPAQNWATNQVVPAAGNPGTGYGAAPGGAPVDPNEMRVSRLEKVAFGSTYPEHEVADRVDHLEKEIFGDSQPGDLQARLNRLENKLGAGSSFGSPMRSQNSGQYGSYAGGSAPVQFAPVSPNGARTSSDFVGSAAVNPNAGQIAQAAPAIVAPPVAEVAQELALKSPDDLNAQDSNTQGSNPGSNSSDDGDEDNPGTTQAPDTDSPASDDTSTSPAGSTDDDSASPSSDTTIGAPSKSSGSVNTNSRSSKLLSMADGKSISSASNSSGKQATVRIPYDTSAGNYIGSISRFANNATARWTNFPVRVRLPEDATAEWKKLMEPGIEKWGRYLPLKKVSLTEGADIEVSFVNHLVPRVLGVTRLTVNGGRMKVSIFMLRPNYYPAIAEKTLSHAFLHELGHAIGIFGHSEKSTDLMSTFEVASSGNGKLTQEKLGTISARDVNTLKLIYDADPLPEDFNLSAPQEWGYVYGADCS